MGRTTLQKVLGSGVLPRPQVLYATSPARARREASSTTVAEPVIRRVSVDGSEILLTRLIGGQVVAFAPHCPHQQTPLEHASIFEGRIRCPKHQYLYDPRTGENVFPSQGARPEAMCKLRPGYLAVYPVEEHDGWIWVAAQPLPPPATYHPELEEPALAGREPAPPAEPAPQPPAGPERLVENVEAVEGEEFELVLAAQLLPACLWRLECPDGLVELVSQAFDPEDKRYRLRLTARERGEVTLRCHYARPWDREPKETRTISLRVVPAG